MDQQPLFLNSKYGYQKIYNDLKQKKLRCNNIEINQDSLKKKPYIENFHNDFNTLLESVNNINCDDIQQLSYYNLSNDLTLINDFTFENNKAIINFYDGGKNIKFLKNMQNPYYSLNDYCAIFYYQIDFDNFKNEDFVISCSYIYNDSILNERYYKIATTKEIDKNPIMSYEYNKILYTITDKITLNNTTTNLSDNANFLKSQYFNRYTHMYNYNLKNNYDKNNQLYLLNYKKINDYEYFVNYWNDSVIIQNSLYKYIFNNTTLKIFDTTFKRIKNFDIGKYKKLIIITILAYHFIFKIDSNNEIELTNVMEIYDYKFLDIKDCIVTFTKKDGSGNIIETLYQFIPPYQSTNNDINAYHKKITNISPFYNILKIVKENQKSENEKSFIFFYNKASFGIKKIAIDDNMHYIFYDQFNDFSTYIKFNDDNTINVGTLDFFNISDVEKYKDNVNNFSINKTNSFTNNTGCINSIMVSNFDKDNTKIMKNNRIVYVRNDDNSMLNNDIIGLESNIVDESGMTINYRQIDNGIEKNFYSQYFNDKKSLNSVLFNIYHDKNIPNEYTYVFSLGNTHDIINLNYKKYTLSLKHQITILNDITGKNTIKSWSLCFENKIPNPCNNGEYYTIGGSNINAYICYDYNYDGNAYTIDENHYIIGIGDIAHINFFSYQSKKTDDSTQTTDNQTQTTDDLTLMTDGQTQTTDDQSQTTTKQSQTKTYKYQTKMIKFHENLKESYYYLNKSIFILDTADIVLKDDIDITVSTSLIDILGKSKDIYIDFFSGNTFNNDSSSIKSINSTITLQTYSDSESDPKIKFNYLTTTDTYTPIYVYDQKQKCIFEYDGDVIIRVYKNLKSFKYFNINDNQLVDIYNPNITVSDNYSYLNNTFCDSNNNIISFDQSNFYFKYKTGDSTSNILHKINREILKCKSYDNVDMTTEICDFIITNNNISINCFDYCYNDNAYEIIENTQNNTITLGKKECEYLNYKIFLTPHTNSDNNLQLINYIKAEIDGNLKIIDCKKPDIKSGYPTFYYENIYNIDKTTSKNKNSELECPEKSIYTLTEYDTTNEKVTEENWIYNDNYQYKLNKIYNVDLSNLNSDNYVTNLKNNINTKTTHSDNIIYTKNENEILKIEYISSQYLNNICYLNNDISTKLNYYQENIVFFNNLIIPFNILSYDNNSTKISKGSITKFKINNTEYDCETAQSLSLSFTNSYYEINNDIIYNDNGDDKYIYIGSSYKKSTYKKSTDITYTEFQILLKNNSCYFQSNNIPITVDINDNNITISSNNEVLTINDANKPLKDTEGNYIISYNFDTITINVKNYWLINIDYTNKTITDVYILELDDEYYFKINLNDEILLNSINFAYYFEQDNESKKITNTKYFTINQKNTGIYLKDSNDLLLIQENTEYSTDNTAKQQLSTFIYDNKTFIIKVYNNDISYIVSNDIYPLVTYYNNDKIYIIKIDYNNYYEYNGNEYILQYDSNNNINKIIQINKGNVVNIQLSEDLITINVRDVEVISILKKYYYYYYNIIETLITDDSSIIQESVNLVLKPPVNTILEDNMISKNGFRFTNYLIDMENNENKHSINDVDIIFYHKDYNKFSVSYTNFYFYIYDTITFNNTTYNFELFVIYNTENPNQFIIFKFIINNLNPTVLIENKIYTNDNNSYIKINNDNVGVKVNVDVKLLPDNSSSEDSKWKQQIIIKFTENYNDESPTSTDYNYILQFDETNTSNGYCNIAYSNITDDYNLSIPYVNNDNQRSIYSSNLSRNYIDFNLQNKLICSSKTEHGSTIISFVYDNKYFDLSVNTFNLRISNKNKSKFDDLAFLNDMITDICNNYDFNNIYSRTINNINATSDNNITVKSNNNNDKDETAKFDTKTFNIKNNISSNKDNILLYGHYIYENSDKDTFEAKSITKNKIDTIIYNSFKNNDLLDNSNAYYQNYVKMYKNNYKTLFGFENKDLPINNCVISTIIKNKKSSNINNIINIFNVADYLEKTEKHLLDENKKIISDKFEEDLPLIDYTINKQLDIDYNITIYKILDNNNALDNNVLIVDKNLVNVTLDNCCDNTIEDKTNNCLFYKMFFVNTDNLDYSYARMPFNYLFHIVNGKCIFNRHLLSLDNDFKKIATVTIPNINDNIIPNLIEINIDDDSIYYDSNEYQRFVNYFNSDGNIVKIEDSNLLNKNGSLLYYDGEKVTSYINYDNENDKNYKNNYSNTKKIIFNVPYYVYDIDIEKECETAKDIKYKMNYNTTRLVKKAMTDSEYNAYCLKNNIEYNASLFDNKQDNDTIDVILPDLNRTKYFTYKKKIYDVTTSNRSLNHYSYFKTNNKIEFKDPFTMNYDNNCLDFY